MRKLSLLLLVWLMAEGSVVGAAMGKPTQIVVQWRYQGSAGLTTLWRLYWREHVIAKRCGDLCFVDGHDLGSGTANIFLYAEDANVDATVRAIVSSFEQGELPAGMQIGVAQYKNDARSDWEYRPAFPPGLPHFDITYPGDPRGL